MRTFNSAIIRKDKSIKLYLVIICVLAFVNLLFIESVIFGMFEKDDSSGKISLSPEASFDEIESRVKYSENSESFAATSAKNEDKIEVGKGIGESDNDERESERNQPAPYIKSDFNQDNINSIYINGLEEEEDLLVKQNLGYIIEFNEEPILEKQMQENEDISAKDLKKKIQTQKKKIENERELAIESIREILGKDRLKIEEIYENAFNGALLYITEEEANKILDLEYVRAIYPNKEVSAYLMNNTLLVGASVVWNMQDNQGRNVTGEGITIAIIDTGIDYTLFGLGNCTREEFLGKTCSKVVDGYDFINQDNDPIDDNGHGTYVASIASGNGVLKGVAPGSKIIAYKSLDNAGNGNDAQIISAIEKSVDPNGDGDFSDHVDVISMSLGRIGDPDDVLSRAVDSAVDAGVVVVVAVGNDGPNNRTIGSPATARKAISVGASDVNNIASFSSKGPVIWTDAYGEKQILIKPDLVAPGVNICALRHGNYGSQTCLGSGYVRSSGTSMSTPFVSGSVALIKQLHPDWSAQEIKSVLKNTATDLQNQPVNIEGNGRLNATLAVSIEGRPVVAKLVNEEYEIFGNFSIYGSIEGEFDSYEVYYSDNLSCSGQECRKNLICTGESKGPVLCENFNSEIINDGEYIFSLIVEREGIEIAKDKTIFEITNLNIPQVSEFDNYIVGDEIVNAEINSAEYEHFRIEYKKSSENNWNELCRKNFGEEDFCEIDNNLDEGMNLLRLSIFKEEKYIYDEPTSVIVIENLNPDWSEDFPCQPFAPLAVIGDEIKSIAQASSSRCGSYGSQNSWYGGETNITIKRGTKDYEFVRKINGFARYPVSAFGDNLFISSPYQLESVQNQDGYLRNWINTNYSEVSMTPATIIDGKIFIVKGLIGQNIYLQGYYENGSMIEEYPVNMKQSANLTFESVSNQIVELRYLSEKRMAISFSATEEDGKTRIYVDIYHINGTLAKRTIVSEDSWNSLEYVVSSLVGSDSNHDMKSEVILGLTSIVTVNDIRGQLIIVDPDEESALKPYIINAYSIAHVLPVVGEYSNNIAFALRDTLPTTYAGQRAVLIDREGNVIFDSNLGTNLKMIETMSAADIDGDMHPELIVGHRPRWWNGISSGLMIYNLEGELVEEIDIPTFGQVDLLGTGVTTDFTPIVTDIDNDGKTDIIQQTMYISTEKSAPWKSHVFTFSLDKNYNKDGFNWEQFQGNIRKTGCIDCEINMCRDGAIDLGGECLQDADDANLVAHYSFDNSFEDKSAMSNDGEGKNGLGFEHLATGNTAIKFDGVDDYIEIASSESLRLGEMSVSFWIRGDENIPDYRQRAIFSKGNPADPLAMDYWENYDYSFIIGREAGSGNINTISYNGTLKGYLMSGIANAQNTNTQLGINFMLSALSDGEWHMITVVRGNEFSSLYVDGILKTNTTYSGFGISEYYTSDSPLLFGSYPYGTPKSPIESYLKASLDEVRIYNKPISSKTIEALYNSQKNRF